MSSRTKGVNTHQKFNDKIKKLVDKEFSQYIESYKSKDDSQYAGISEHVWRIRTKAGILRVMVTLPDPSALFSIFCQFEDVDKANSIIPVPVKGIKDQLNRFSGKWNFHYTDMKLCLTVFFMELSEII